MVIDMTAMATRVAAALRLSGGRNAGTPFDTASTPVMAVQPLENALNSVNVVMRPRLPDARASGAWATGCSVPVKYRHVPTAIMARMLTMKK